MTQDKELLLKDLCARLPYNVRVEYNGTTLTNIFDVLGVAHGRIMLCLPFMSKTECPLIEEVKPYLFPLSSMTDEQKEELNNITDGKFNANCKYIDNCRRTNFSEWGTTEYNWITERDVDLLHTWLNKNHFDYRGLIPKGLAIDATGLNIY